MNCGSLYLGVKLSQCCIWLSALHFFVKRGFHDKPNHKSAIGTFPHVHPEVI